MYGENHTKGAVRGASYFFAILWHALQDEDPRQMWHEILLSRKATFGCGLHLSGRLTPDPLSTHPPASQPLPSEDPSGCFAATSVGTPLRLAMLGASPCRRTPLRLLTQPPPLKRGGNGYGQAPLFRGAVTAGD